jgi:uncharacterized protein YcfJ
MKKFAAIVAILVSSVSFAQEVRYANIVSVTPVKENVQVVKQQCGGSAGYNQQEPGYMGRVVGVISGTAIGSRFGQGTGKVAATAVGAGLGYVAGDAYDNSGNVQPKCRAITTYEPTFGGFLVVYELDGRQYTTRSKTFPEGRTIPVQMQPTPIN